jgi:Ca-activated chloride channel family protein
VHLVTLDVVVRDASGRLATDLTADDFLVLEDGAPQRVAIFARADALPLNIVLLLDRSASMYGEKLERACVAAEEFARTLRPGDHLEVIAFNQRAVMVPADASHGGNPVGQLGSLTAKGATALYDAMLLAANQLQRARAAKPNAVTRDLIIVLSDGEDTASLTDFEEVLPALRRSGALVYGLSLRAGKDGQALGATWPLQALARDTGARAVGVRQLATLSDLYAEIDAEVRSMYRLGYVSTKPQGHGEWRALTVRTVGRDTHVRTRSGYYAGSAVGRR